MKKIQGMIWRKKWGKFILLTMDVDRFLQNLALQAMVHFLNNV
jgi:hypothetical protein